MESLGPNSRKTRLTERACRSPTRLTDASANSRVVFNESILRLEDFNGSNRGTSRALSTVGKSQGGAVRGRRDSFSWRLRKIELPPEHVSGAERGASEERSVQNIVGARSGFLSKGWSDRSVSLRFHSDTAHTTSLGHAQIHPEFTCAFNN